MANYAPNYTARYKLSYRVFGMSHSATFRLERTTAPGDLASFVTKLGLFLSDLAPNLYTSWTVIKAEFADGNSDLFLPVAAPAQPSAGASQDGLANSRRAQFIQFVGKGMQGSKGSFYIYGYNVGYENGISSDFRITSLENSAISAAITRLSETSPAEVAIDNSNMLWYPYVNVKTNDHYVHAIRNGG